METSTEAMATVLLNPVPATMPLLLREDEALSLQELRRRLQARAMLLFLVASGQEAEATAERWRLAGSVASSPEPVF